MSIAKPTGISTSWYVLILAAANTLLFHLPLANYSLNNINASSLNGLRTLFTLLVIVFAVSVILFFTITLISTRLLKWLAVMAAVGNAIALYFINTYQVILDKSMMGNIFNTQTSESTEFLHPKMLIYVVLLGIVPAWLILKARVQPVRRVRACIYIVAMLGITLATIYINATTTLWFDKHSRRLGGMMLPWSYTINSARLLADRFSENREIKLLPSPTSMANRKTVVVLVIGETARAKNFSVYGYERQTNPLIAASDAIVLPNSKACSTYTTASIHCMLSHTGAPRGAIEPLPSYLQRHNVEVVWRTNNWGEPNIIVEQYVKSPILRAICTSEYCDHDEVLLTGLVDRIESASKDNVLVVLHTKGSHGPAYHSRYPKDFERFKPACKSVELNNCTSAELTNAYDNTIVYTDYFLNSTIDQLKRLSDRSTVMLYVSDHGESLGEFGLYLHGTPNAIAPAVQLDIPFIIWMSDRFKKINDIQPDQFSHAAYSHKHVFHSIMGAFGMRGSVYDKALDIFQPGHAH